MKNDNNKKTTELISDDEKVTSYKCGNYTEIVCCKHEIVPFEITRLSRSQYLDNVTGEVKKYPTISCKSVENFKNDFKNIPRYIKGYFNGDLTEKFITLTYSSYMDNPYQLSYDFKKFIRKVERRYDKCRYFYVKEPQANGSWHIHSIIKCLSNKEFIINEKEICSIWDNGNEVSVRNITNINTLAYYFDITRYKHKKERLKYYPSYFRIYGHSADMKIYKQKGKYKSLKPQYADMIYEKNNENIFVDISTGEIKSLCKNVYQQFVERN